MYTTQVKRITIVAERILKDRLINEILSLGAKGYTISDARGKGQRGVRASDWEGPDIKIEVIAGKETAEKIAHHVSENYFELYAVIIYLHDVEVIRGDKYI